MKLKHACVDAGQYGINVSPDAYVGTGMRLIRTSDLTPEGLTNPDDGIFLEGTVDDRFVVQPNDILLSRAGTVGRSFLVPPEAAGSTFAGFLVRFRPAPGHEARYLNYALQSLPVQEAIQSEAVASTIQNFNADRYANLNLPDQPSETQRRIADFLDDRVARIDRIIAARKQQISLVSASYQAWLDELVSHYSSVPLRRHLLSIEQGWSPLTDSLPAASGEPGVLKLGAVRGGDFRPGENKVFLGETAPREDYLVRDCDLLVTRANTPALVGDVAVVRGAVDRRLYLSDLIYRVRLSGYDPDLASAALRTSGVRQVISVMARGTSGSMPKLRGEDLAGLPLPAVPAEKQKKLGQRDVDQRRERDRRKGQLARSTELLTEYKASLITAAVTGELDVLTAGSGIPT